ncbi:MmcQ/YjbR family DNA-binding protein [Streptomyces sp. AN091965]|uniref:MmcQ/YjbR family DNA-binding protein n=1 Tax=Streptomyces sp. AN091965 TaxID=2927803 RepID=UPI001F615376|nr:MmcQ/YjbR family DNA-binding protein [Streptomyces sp. AN091965]MCI3930222.1 MmcQ/YjbR family DNA-binding protein [Streptomyces sp. AN091965]
MTTPPDAEVPLDALAHLRGICGRLPEAYEERAWTGVRWRVRGRTFAHVYVSDPASPAATHAHAAVPTTTLTFRAHGEELAALTNAGPPFFRLGRGADVVALHLDAAAADWSEIAELLVESYRSLAPKKLAALLDEDGRGWTATPLS